MAARGRTGRPLDSGDGRTVAAAVLYALMLIAAAGIFLVIRQAGARLSAALPAVAPQTPLPVHSDVLLHVLLALAMVVTLGNMLGALCRRIGQPPVVGEVIAGLLLGPSVLGALSPRAAAFVLPGSIAPFLGVISQLGVILYMFQVGIELNHGFIRGRGHATLAISHTSIVLPLLLGAGLSLWLFPRFAPPRPDFLGFSLFMGVAMAVTAFPVLARILSDQGLAQTPLGSLALSCAAVDDVTAWCLLASAVSVVESKSGLLRTFLWLIGFLAAFWILARPLLRRAVDLINRGRSTKTVLALVLVGVLLSSLSTELIGVHAIFGAFLLGALIPHDSRLAREFETKLKDIVAMLLLPAFFAFTGMRTEIGLVAGGEAWLALCLIIVVATVGKFGGTWLSARLVGTDPQEAVALGILMNTRGLVELIVLNLGLEAGVISKQLFAMMVIMAVVTTVGTAPALRLFTPGVLARAAEPREDRRQIV